MSLWDGWPPDYADAVEGLCWLEERAERAERIVA